MRKKDIKNEYVKLARENPYIFMGTNCNEFLTYQSKSDNNNNNINIVIDMIKKTIDIKYE